MRQADPRHAVVTDGAALAAIEARIRALGTNDGRYYTQLGRRLTVDRQPGRVRLTGDRRDVEGFARLVFETDPGLRVAQLEEKPRGVADIVTLTLAGGATP